MMLLSENARGEAAVSVERGTGDEAGERTIEKHHWPRLFTGLRHATHQLGPVLNHLGAKCLGLDRLGELTTGRRAGTARIHAVHPDAVLVEGHRPPCGVG